MQYPETTLEDFKARAVRHANGEKSGVTICWKGLPLRDRFTAQSWMQIRREREAWVQHVHEVRLRAEAARLSAAKVARWDDLLERLSAYEVTR